MYTALIIDFSRVLIFSHKDVESLNKHHRQLAKDAADYHVLDHFYLNEELLAFLNNIAGNIDIYLFSDGALHELPDIYSRINPVFTRILTAKETGHKKNDPQAYRHLVRLLNISPGATIFLDDKVGNVKAAAYAGMKAIRFENNEQAIASLKELVQ